MSEEEVRQRIMEIGLQEHKDIIHCVRKAHFSTDLAEECLQEAYVEALTHANQIQSPEKLKSWLTTVAMRKAHRDTYQYFRIANACKSLPNRCDNTEDTALLRMVVVDAVAKVLRKFPPHYADIMRLRYVYHYSSQEIGQALNLRPAAVRQANLRVKRALIKELGTLEDLMEE